MLTESFSGVRGRYGGDITGDLAMRYAHALGRETLARTRKTGATFVVGGDTRPSSRSLMDIFIRVLRGYGDVIDVGVQSTPAVELAVREFGADGGAIVTASHNEPADNGWKLLGETGAVLGPAAMARVIRTAHAKPAAPAGKEGTVSRKGAGLADAYIRFVLDTIGKGHADAIRKRGFSVVADPNGGTAGLYLATLFGRLGITGIYRNIEPGVFARRVEPDGESIGYLGAVARKGKADLAVGFDCDADRAEFVLPSGRMVSGQEVLALLVDEALADAETGAVVVANAVTSNLVTEIAERHGARVEHVDVGEINVVERMDELQSPVGGEGSSSGGIFPPSRCRDGILTFAMVLRLLSRTGKGIEAILDSYPRYYSGRTKVSCDPEAVPQVRQLLSERYESQGRRVERYGDGTGGLKAWIGEKSFIFFRASKTEAGQFRIVSDADDEQEAERILAEGRSLLMSLLRKL
ncbi:hypothetical protein JXB02_00810 [Candidatus Woesearchaeota archaeon]|nr:hypothetical protein [Candidatus Woesearchaeota archaeon]